MSHTSRTVYDVTHVTSSLKDIVFQNKKMRKSPGTSPSVFGGNKIQRLFKSFGNFTQCVWRKQNPYGAITLNLKHFLKKSLLGTSPSVFSGNKIQFMGKNGFCFRKTRSVKFPKVKKENWILFPQNTLGEVPKMDFFNFHWILFPRNTIGEVPSFWILFPWFANKG